LMWFGSTVIKFEPNLKRKRSDHFISARCLTQILDPFFNTRITSGRNDGCTTIVSGSSI
jgi:hypothetical protein